MPLTKQIVLVFSVRDLMAWLLVLAVNCERCEAGTPPQRPLVIYTPNDLLGSTKKGSNCFDFHTGVNLTKHGGRLRCGYEANAT